MQTPDTFTLLTQVRALLAQTFGGGAESFQSLLPDVQDSYLAAVSGLVDQALAQAAQP